MTLEGAADTLAFEAFVEQVLCPTLQLGQIVVLDNLSIHQHSSEWQSARVDRGVWLSIVVPADLFA